MVVVLLLPLLLLLRALWLASLAFTSLGMCDGSILKSLSVGLLWEHIAVLAVFVAGVLVGLAAVWLAAHVREVAVGPRGWIGRLCWASNCTLLRPPFTTSLGTTPERAGDSQTKQIRRPMAQPPWASWRSPNKSDHAFLGPTSRGNFSSWQSSCIIRSRSWGWLPMYCRSENHQAHRDYSVTRLVW